MRASVLALLSALTLAVTITPGFAGDDKATPSTVAATVAKATTLPAPATKKIGTWITFAHTLELPGLDEENLHLQREARLKAVTRAVNKIQPKPEGSRMELTDVEGRRGFNKFVRDNPKIRPEDYRKYLAELYNGAVLVQRIICCEDGQWRAVDEEPVLLTGGIEEWTKVQRLLASPINLAAQTPKAPAAIASTADTQPKVIKTASATEPPASGQR
jgi:hypothetical protein